MLNTDDRPVCFDRLCVRCSANLIDQPRNGDCPNCGTPVARSLDDAPFIVRSPWLLSRLIRGGRFVFWGNLAFVLVMFATFVTAVVRPHDRWIVPALGAVLFALDLLIHAGWWGLSRPDPDADEPGSRRLRRPIRATVLVSFGLIMVNLGLATAALLAHTPGSAQPSPVLATASALTSLGYLLVCLVRSVVSRSYLQWIIALATTNSNDYVPDYRVRWYHIVLAILLPWHLIIEPLKMYAAVWDATARLKKCRRLRDRLIATAGKPGAAGGTANAAGETAADAAVRLAAVGAHMARLLGGKPDIRPGLDVPPIRLFFLIYPPSNKRAFTAVVTSGMSALPQNVSPADEVFRFVELCFMLPPDWPTDERSLRDDRHAWPFKLAEAVARTGHLTGAPIALAHTVDAGLDAAGGVVPGSPFSTALTLPTFGFDLGAFAMQHEGRRIVFLTIVPLFPEERGLVLARGVPALLGALERTGTPLTALMNPHRTNAAGEVAPRAMA